MRKIKAGVFVCVLLCISISGTKIHASSDGLDIRTILGDCERFRPHVERARDMDITVFFGNVGAGKTTLVNLLAGIPLYIDGEGRVAARGGLPVGAGRESVTQYPESLDSEELGLIFDSPGVNGNEAAERNIVQVKLFNELLRGASTVKMVFVLQARDVTAGRGGASRELNEKLRFFSESRDPVFISGSSLLIINQVEERTRSTCISKIKSQSPFFARLIDSENYILIPRVKAEGDTIETLVNRRTPIVEGIARLAGVSLKEEGRLTSGGALNELTCDRLIDHLEGYMLEELTRQTADWRRQFSRRSSAEFRAHKRELLREFQKTPADGLIGLLYSLDPELCGNVFSEEAFSEKFDAYVGVLEAREERERLDRENTFRRMRQDQEHMMRMQERGDVRYGRNIAGLGCEVVKGVFSGLREVIAAAARNPELTATIATAVAVRQGYLPKAPGKAPVSTVPGKLSVPTGKGSPGVKAPSWMNPEMRALWESLEQRELELKEKKPTVLQEEAPTEGAEDAKLPSAVPSSSVDSLPFVRNPEELARVMEAFEIFKLKKRDFGIAPKLASTTVGDDDAEEEEEFSEFLEAACEGLESAETLGEGGSSGGSLAAASSGENGK